MTQVKVMSIADLLWLKHLRNSTSHAIVFITTKPNYYDFGSTLYYKFTIADTDAPIVGTTDMQRIHFLCRHCEDLDTIYVCCDAGLSRSPAIAHYIAVQIGEFSQAEEMETKYRFMNKRLYEKLLGV